MAEVDLRVCTSPAVDTQLLVNVDDAVVVVGFDLGDKRMLFVVSTYRSALWTGDFDDSETEKEKRAGLLIAQESSGAGITNIGWAGDNAEAGPESSRCRRGRVGASLSCISQCQWASLLFSYVKSLGLRESSGSRNRIALHSTPYWRF